jgi:hypothetical protein
MTHELPNLSVNKIIWAQAGQMVEPSRYMFKLGWLTVSESSCRIDKQFTGAFPAAKEPANMFPACGASGMKST